MNNFNKNNFIQIEPSDITRLRTAGFFLLGKKISLRTPGKEDGQVLAKVLCEDSALRKCLGIPGKEQPTGESFLAKIDQWCEQTHSITLAIREQERRAVGLISLSHIKSTDRSAGIGYWLGSACWNLGYTREAFDLILDLAQRLQIKRVFATVHKDNVASRRIWERYRCLITKKEDAKIHYAIELA